MGGQLSFDPDGAFGKRDYILILTANRCLQLCTARLMLYISAFSRYGPEAASAE